MSEGLNYEDFYYFFSRWKDAYPYGVPVDQITVPNDSEEIAEILYGKTNKGDSSESAIETAPTESSSFQAIFDYQFSVSPAQIVFVLYRDSARLVVSESEVELLQKVISQGLKMSPADDCALLLVGDSAVNSLSLIHI